MLWRVKECGRLPTSVLRGFQRAAGAVRCLHPAGESFADLSPSCGLGLNEAQGLSSSVLGTVRSR